MSQQQRHRESSQLALAAELAAGEGEALAGNIVLPAGRPVPLALEASAVARLWSANAINLEATANDDGATVAFSVSIKGFLPPMTA